MTTFDKWRTTPCDANTYNFSTYFHRNKQRRRQRGAGRGGMGPATHKGPGPMDAFGISNSTLAKSR